MRTVFLAFICLVFSSFSIAQTSLSSFHEISATGSVQVTLKKGDKNQYTATGDTDKLKVEVDNGRLKVSRIDVQGGWNDRAIVTVWYKEIRSLNASAGAQVSHEGTLNAGDFELSTDTGANADVEIDAQSVEVVVGEGGVLRLAGACRVLDAKMTTGGVLKGRDLIAHTVYVSANTGSNASVHASDEIDASASLGASISYSGDPKIVKVKESLGGSVRK